MIRPLSLAVAITLAASVYAASSIRNPVSALSPVQNVTIHTTTGRVSALAHFDLSFTLRDDLHVKFRLEPNHDILGHGATVSTIGPDGSVDRHELVDRLRHKVYKGSAWVRRPRAGQTDWTRVGWARVSIRQDGPSPLFDGAFAVHRDHHHIQTSSNYLRTRHLRDPWIDQKRNGHDYMVLWRDSDLASDDHAGSDHAELRRRRLEDTMCLHDTVLFNTMPDHPVYSRTTPATVLAKRALYGVMDFSRIFRRQTDGTTGGNAAGVNLISSIGDTSGCPTTRKVALVGIATDCTYTADFEDEESARENILSQMNEASALWEDTFNISLGVQNITLSGAQCPVTPAPATEWNQDCSSSVSIEDRLNMFSLWRGTLGGDNSHWTLLTTCATGTSVGLAWLGQACVADSITTNSSVTGNGRSSVTGDETVSGANVVVRSSGSEEWQVIAHETAHTFGAVHDCTSSTCAQSDLVAAQQCCPLSSDTCDADGSYIMNPSTSDGVTGFSPCTVGNICSAIGRRSVDTTCLSDNSNVPTVTGQQCGNGIVETGEECDCGGEEACQDDPCCDPDTCLFTDGSVCDDANEECCNNCQLASAGTVCRESTGECDPEEFCSGDAGNCPDDVNAPDGEDCGDADSDLQCASGMCTSRDSQCQSVMGSYTSSNDTQACDSSTCIISCSSPEFGTGVCYGLQQNFLDGTTCSGGGSCENVRPPLFSPFSVYFLVRTPSPLYFFSHPPGRLPRLLGRQRSQILDRGQPQPRHRPRRRRRCLHFLRPPRLPHLASASSPPSPASPSRHCPGRRHHRHPRRPPRHALGAASAPARRLAGLGLPPALAIPSDAVRAPALRGLLGLEPARRSAAVVWGFGAGTVCVGGAESDHDTRFFSPLSFSVLMPMKPGRTEPFLCPPLRNSTPG